MACVALTSLMRTLELEFLQPNPRLILKDTEVIESLFKKLTFLQTFLDESEKKAHNCKELNDLIARIRGVTLKAEYDIEAELVKDDDPTMTKLRLGLGAESDSEAEIVEDDDPMMTNFRLALEAESENEAELVEDDDPMMKIFRLALRAESDIEAELVEDDDPMMTNFRLSLETEPEIEAELVEDDDPMTKLRLALGAESDNEAEIVEDGDPMTKFTLAPEGQYDIEAELVASPHQRLDVTLRRVLEDVEHLIVMIEARKAKGLQTHHQHYPDESSSSAGQSSSQHASKSEDTMVGQTKEFEEFKKQLLSSNEPLQVTSLVGMGGIGKTTFARKLADDSAVKLHFDPCGWATMSQEHNKRQVLLQLCHSVMPIVDDINTMKDDDLANQLRRSLCGRRYLIIVDDIWTEGAWDDVKRCFPSEVANTGSQILLTTRLKKVSDYACSSNLSHDMRFLSSDESWNLFRQKFLVRECLNKEFERIGRKIVERCQGLPLTVVVLAGHLSTNMVVEEWKRVKSMLNSLVNLDLSDQFSRILGLSYNNLPCHLKSCFLYLGAFPEDSEIRIKKVIRLWIAEGFIKEESQKTLEESGEDYLQDLMNRSLIMASGRSSNGKVETCKMHDLLHELCASKAKIEKLLCTRDTSKHGYYIGSDGNRWLSLKIVSQRSLCLTALEKSRSILCFDMHKWNDHDWHLNWLASSSKMRANSFKMLRVLDLTVLDYNGSSIPSDIIDVVLLRYLALSSNWLLNSIPLRRNRNLQTLIICEDMNGVRNLPCGIWELPQLRHLELYHQLIPMYTPDPQVAAQVNLQTMYWLQCIQCRNQVFSRIPNVKELGIIAQGCISHRCLDDLNCLKKLEKLKVQGSYYCPIKLPSHVDAFPQNLKEITFAKTLMPWEAMNVIGMLPKLEVLKLKNHACVGQEWELTVERGFPELKVLIISVMDLKHWKLAHDGEYTFQVLERLVLRNCFELKEMPSWIEKLSSNLKSIRLEHCHASLVTSARMIEEEQRENYGEEYGFEIVEFHTQSDQKNSGKLKNMYFRFWNCIHSTLSHVSLHLCHSFAEENDEDIQMSVFLEATSLYIPHENNPQYWIWTRDSGHKVAELLGVCWLEIKGKLDTRRLLEITSYSAYLIFKLNPMITGGLDTAFTSVRYIKDKGSYNENRRCQVFLAKEKSSSGDPGRFPNRRHDGWMEIKLGDFYISSGNEGEVEMRLWSTENVHWKSGLIVKGIEVRPN